MRWVLLVLLAGGCKNEHDLHKRTGTDTWHQVPTDQVDLLFVVDDSHSMAEEQTILGDGFGTLMDEVEATGTDFHIAVITTSFDYADSQRGRFIGDPPVLTVEDDYRGLFAERVKVGTTGSDKEKGLEAAAFALSATMRNGDNAGFLREDADLLVIFVSDEDDCSDEGVLEGEPPTACYDRRDDLAPVEGFVADFFALKDEADKVHLGGIIGPKKAEGCDEAVPGFRYMDVARLTAGPVGNICEADWSGPMAEMGMMALGMLESFRLSDPALPETLEVYVDDEQVVESDTAGWTYDAETLYLTFHGAAVPPRESTIVAHYTIGY